MSRTNETRRKKGKTIRRKRDKYNKIPLKSKLIFFEMVIHQQGNFRDVAQKLGIKYSTAKTLIRNYKFMREEGNEEMVQTLVKDFESENRPRKRCSYKLIDEGAQILSTGQRGDSGREDKSGESSRIEIICTTLG